MSEFLAEVRIVVRPDTSRFRRDLEAQLRSAVAPIKVPVVPVAGVGFAAAVAGTSAFAAAQTQAAAATGVSAEALAAATRITAQYTGVVDLAAVSTQALAASQGREAVSATKAAAAQAAHARSLSQVFRGAGASGLTLFGLRGATLAASGAFLAGTAAVVAFSKAVKSAAQLQTELNVFQVTAGATADEMDRAAEAARRLGRDITLPGVTAGDAAQALTQLAKAGLSVRDSLDAAKGTLQLATAAQIDNVAATNLVASALNSFALGGAEAVRVADLLTGAAKESQGEITDMGTALQQASAVAKLAGINIEDTVTFLTQLARAGLSGGRAGTSLRVALLRLINPTGEAAKKLKELNIQLRDSSGNISPKVFTDIATALQGLSKAQQQATLATIFGTDAIRSAAIIGGQGSEAFLKLRDSVTESGLAQQQAAARTKGFQGSVENLSNQFENLGTTVGKFTLGPGKLLVDFLAQTASDLELVVSGLGLAGQAFDNFNKSVDKALGIDESFDKKVQGFFGDTIKNALRVGPLLIEFAIDQTKAKASAQSVREQIDNIVKSGEKTGGELGLNETLVNLDGLVEKLKQGSPAAQKFADSVALVRSRLSAASGVRIFPENVRDLFPPELLLGTISKEAGEKNVSVFKQAMSGDELFDASLNAFGRVGDAIEIAGVSAAEKAKIAIANIIGAATTQLARLGEAFDVAVAADSQAGQLASLKKQAAEQQKIIDAANKAAQTAGPGRKGFDTAVKVRRDAQKQLASVNTQIRGIEDQILSDQKQAASEAQRRANDAQQARNDADRAFLDSVSGREAGLQNQLLLAETRKGLADDIKRNEALRDFYKQSREQAAKTIQDAKLRLSTVQSFTRSIIQINKTITDLTAQQAQNQKDAQEARRKSLLEGINLDIDFDQTIGNKKKELNDRNRLIAQLKIELQTVKKGTVAYKEIRNAIAEQNKAIADITAEKRKQGQSFAQASFEFLQAQQGFAANLLGNLIPSGATGGLVGGGVSQALQPVAGAAEARSQSGPTAGQGNATNHLLFQILQQLKEANGETKAPEARRQRAHSWSLMDGVGGG